MSEPTGTPSTTAIVDIVNEEAPQKKRWRSKILNWLTYDKNEWLQDMRGGLGLIASIVATITFQSALNPPGGVFQAGLDDKINLFNCSIPNSTYLLCAGEAVLSLTKRSYYTSFLVCNTTCFVVSLCVCLLLVSGLPLKNRFTLWLLLIAMCITLTTLLLAYFTGVLLVTPDAIVGGNVLDSWFSYLLLAFLILFVVVGVLQVLRFVIWCVKECLQLCNCC